MKSDPKNIDQRKLVLYLLDEISEPGRFEVEIWLDESQEHRDEYEELKKTWSETGEFDFFPRKINVDDTWSKFSKKLDDVIVEKPAAPDLQTKTRTLRFFYAAAAVLFFAWVSVTTIRLIQNDGFKAMDVLASQENVIQDTLKDGSKVQLNENSTIKFARRFNENDRKVELEGEAFFDVKPDSLRPFIVETERGRVKVLGTSFQVKGFPDTDLEVFVEEGIVELSGSKKAGETTTLLLRAGERGIIRYPGGEIQKGETINPDDLFWANKKLIFEETRLSLVFDILRKHYNAEIELDNESISECLLSATFNNEKIDQILAVIAISFELTVDKDQEKYIIKGEGCKNE